MRVTVGRGARELGEAKRAGRAIAVDRDHRLAKLLGERRGDGAADQIDAAADRERNDEVDIARRIFLLRGARRAERHSERKRRPDALAIRAMLVPLGEHRYEAVSKR